MITKKFWTLLLEKLKHPTLNGRLLEAEKNINFPASESLILELDKLKQQIQKWIWQLRSNQNLSPQQANLMARKLGHISKEKEDILFDLKVDDTYSTTEILSLVERLKPIYKAYKDLYHELSTESQKATAALKIPKTAQASCAKIL